MKLLPVSYADRLRSHIDATVAFALQEDLDDIGDVTAELIPAEQMATARIQVKENAVFCGRPWVEAVFAQLDRSVSIDWRHEDGDNVRADTTICVLQGPARSLLTGERTAINFIQTLSGTATVARQYADAAAPQGLIVLDTRKTIPGLRLAQKYAVYAGGCENHRLGLYDTYLIKENHIAAAGSITRAIEKARELRTTQLIIVEVESYEEFREALTAGADRIMLDELPEPDLARVHADTTEIPLESSGSFDLERLQDARSRYVSVGALTKHVRAIDFSMRLEQRD
ncbi:carboxylating nicotinate-nucleotide diphosphorylase [Natronospirillum operosum]|uniref:Probable nicotinate-nucleotide pyrophosphorylase [carboxylating] n=1 Tax=Natronospirillum operosum TaxID=2759953 RepID=A0A4Z0W524_9GAMM|nr:carboxylating nicotinate-nucleotide diphosphorylase [Natronospirillum operosum]TGG92742.1 carboxylating nicotinate-nucleotide diphosphorylase [Natronospirillum operosum]